MKKLQNIVSAACFVACGVLGSSLTMATDDTPNISSWLTFSDNGREGKNDYNLGNLTPQQRQIILDYLKFVKKIGRHPAIVESVSLGGHEDVVLSGGVAFDRATAVPVTVNYYPGTSIAAIPDDQSPEVRKGSYGSFGVQEVTIPTIAGSFKASSPETADAVEKYLKTTVISYRKKGTKFSLSSVRRAQAKEIGIIDAGFKVDEYASMGCCCAPSAPNTNSRWKIDPSIVVHYDAKTKTSKVFVNDKEKKLSSENEKK
ncbi:MAG: hypothetical protein B7Y25_01855 [Alphaproteobacteria bacterium 16-39-46]|nr:MAG: hypothetical protein B7Y25_01855 [Alphaproteobacteria bacterium 16-39-46]OZA43901.1 MAG: hypothetical protein B7X84_01875 [Alphaproteobacteria bacterium 17-39-52]HQS83690.1 hypothetical protein [Alphaproteobacteria bacterium]HQS93458.1 hypothetical protein [Alphaproteobacteria bacterium]